MKTKLISTELSPLLFKFSLVSAEEKIAEGVAGKVSGVEEINEKITN